MQARRRAGVAFALSHTGHLIAIIWLVELAYGGDWSDIDIAGGATIYALIYAMALTSNDRSVRILGARQWKWLHKIGGYAIWVGLTSSYIGNAMASGAPYYWVYSVLALGIFLLRVLAFWKKRITT